MGKKKAKSDQNASSKEPTAPGKEPKAKKQKEAKPPKKLYCYTDVNKGLPVYGVLATWKYKENEQCFSEKQLLRHFKPKLEAFKAPKAPQEGQAPENVQEANASIPKEPAAEGQKKMDEKRKKAGLKRKEFPYLRRLGPNRAIVTFGDMKQANQFAKFKEQDFRFKLSIPVRFVATIAVFEHKRVDFEESDMVLPEGYEMLECEKKKLPNGNMQVSVAVRGSKIPITGTFKNQEVQLTADKRKAALCQKCLRFGHTKENCMRRPRCGFCENRYEGAHSEMNCKHPERSDRCIHCAKEQPTGHEGCDELNRQHKYKMNLVAHSLDYLTLVENMYLKMVRNTKPNSGFRKDPKSTGNQPSKSSKPPKKKSGRSK